MEFLIKKIKQDQESMEKKRYFMNISCMFKQLLDTINQN